MRALAMPSRFSRSLESEYARREAAYLDAGPDPENAHTRGLKEGDALLA